MKSDIGMDRRCLPQAVSISRASLPDKGGTTGDKHGGLWTGPAARPDPGRHVGLAGVGDDMPWHRRKRRRGMAITGKRIG
jgi:hypothetical protein